MEKFKILVVGLGYVGLPLLLRFSQHFDAIGFDKNTQRVLELKRRVDRTKEVSANQLQSINANKFTDSILNCKQSNFIVVTVPTPITEDHKPDLTALRNACIDIATILKRGDLVVFESTVYPGVTEEFCVPILETSGLKYGSDFEVGYSPERVNPGDKYRTLDKIDKIVAGSSDESSLELQRVYTHVTSAPVHIAANIRTAEAAKVIENTQRDVNIALINEFTKIFTKMNLDIHEILAMARTKWNFFDFKPGMVGGHCIGIDPYYLAFSAEQHGINPEMILAGRTINESMAGFYASEYIADMERHNLDPKAATVLVLGATFKSNCPDVRNSKVKDLSRLIKNVVKEVHIYDPLVEQADQNEFDCEFVNVLDGRIYDSVFVAVQHEIYSEIGVLPTLSHFQHQYSILPMNDGGENASR